MEKNERKDGPRCRKCGRPLRDPKSIAAGMGPVCRGERGAPKPKGYKGQSGGKRRGRKGRLPRMKAAGAWGGPGRRVEEEVPKEGEVWKVVKCMVGDEPYLGKVGVVVKVLGRSALSGVWHVRLRFAEGALPEVERAFPVWCLERVDE